MAYNIENAVTIRQAKHADYDAIMEIGDVYQGGDYLQYKFHEFLNDPTIDCVVAEINGRPVGFCCLQSLDEGQSIYTRAGRVHKDYRKLGILHRMINTLERNKEKADPPAKWFTESMTDLNASRGKNDMKTRGFKEVFRKRVLKYEYSITSLRNTSVFGSERVTPIIEMTTDDLKALFENKDMCESLFPYKVLLNKYIGYQVMTGNIRFFINRAARVFASMKSDSRKDIQRSTKKNETSQEKERKRNLSDTEIKDIDMISFFCWHKCPKGVVCGFDVYSSTDTSALEVHVVNCTTKVLPEIGESAGVLMMSFHEMIKDTDALPLLRKYGITDLMVGAESHNVWFRKELKTTQRKRGKDEVPTCKL